MTTAPLNHKLVLEVFPGASEGLLLRPSPYGQQRWCPKGSVSGPVFYNFPMKDLDVGLEGRLSEFGDDTQLGGAVDCLEGRDVLQRDLDKGKGWAIPNLAHQVLDPAPVPGQPQMHRETGKGENVDQPCGKGPGGPWLVANLI